MGAMMRSVDWSQTALGATAGWPQSLKTTVELVLAAPLPMSLFWGPDLVQIYNDHYRPLAGTRHPEALGRAAQESWPAPFRAGGPDRRSVLRGETSSFSKEKLTIDRHGVPEEAWFDRTVAPLRDESGAVAGMLVTAVEKTAEIHAATLREELRYRLKNTLATVQAIAAQTLRKSLSLDDARQSFEARLMALARTHELLTQENWGSADLFGLVTDAVRAYAGGHARFRVKGAPVRLVPRTALAFAMALHELAMNAVRHGALSNQSGVVDIDWWISGETEAKRLRLRWVESGGPPVVPPRHRGFGTRLMEHGLAEELGGAVRITYQPAGVVCTIDAPLPVEKENHGP